MKCDLDIRKVGIKCEFDDGRDFIDAREKIIDAIEELFEVKYKNDDESFLYLTRIIDNGEKTLGKIYSGKYYTRLKNLKKQEKFYFYIELEESFTDDENYKGVLKYFNEEKDEEEEEIEDEFYGFHTLFSNICIALNYHKINFMLHDLTVTVKVPLNNEESENNLLLILESCKNKDNTYNLMENNFIIIDDKFKQHVNIYEKTNMLEIDLNLKSTYIFSPGFYKQDVIDLITKKFILVFFPYDEGISLSYDRLYLVLSEETMHFLKENERILSFNLDALDNFFIELYESHDVLSSNVVRE